MGSRKFGKSVDLNRLLNNRDAVKPRIKNVGIELEGGWEPLKAVRFGVIRDSSVKNLDTSKYHLGEIPSPVLGRVDWQDWLRNHYPDSVNETCGMHVHMSFGLALYYMKCMNPSLPATIVEYMSRWAGDVKLSDTHPIWPRLRGESRYCQHIYSAEDQPVV